MVKSKKKAPPAKPVEEMATDESAAESVQDEEPFYDSMIENGTSDESNDEADAEENDDDDGDDDDDDDEEEESDDGFSDKEESSPPPVVGKRKKPAEENGITHKKYKPDENTELFKQPTVEELNHLNETKNLFHSNLFRMQVEETLRELKLKDKHKKLINAWLEAFIAFVRKLKSDKAKADADNLHWLKSSDIQLPLDLKGIVQKGVQFQFVKPDEDPYFIGSYKQEAVVGSKTVVDVCVTMPDECFQKEDYLNIAYDRKRALYLAYLSVKMRVVPPFNEFEYKFAYFNNNPLKPVIELSPSGKMANKLTLRIFVAAAESSFKLSRFVPWNSNIRGTIFGDENAKDKLPLATPNYNANVLFDLTMKRNQEMLEQALTSNKSLREGLILLKVWLKQRNLNVGYTGFGNHIMSAFVVYLFKQRKLNAAMSSYQVARHVWNHLALSRWDEDGKGITLCSTKAVANQPTLEQFSAHFDVVFVDITGFCNICANLSVDVYRRIKTEAKRAVDILNNMKLNSFHLIFMESCPVYTQFDHIFKFSGDASIRKILTTHGTDADRHNFAGFWFPQILKMVSNILRKGLSDRILHLGPIETICTPWQVDSPPTEVEKTFRLGIILNPERAYEILDKGPQANEDTADSFRQFWGDKSELRRFQDGSITEACVWAATGESFAQKRLIVQRIVLHLLKHHFDVDHVKYIAGELDDAYKLNRIFKVDKLLANVNQETDAETTALEVIKSFDDLGQKLRTLDDLPLDISGIQGTSPVFRYTDPIPILPDGRPTKLGLVSRAVSHGVIQLGVSGKWPNDLTALRALKTAFYVKIADALKEKHKLRTLLRFDGVFILKDGFVFHVEIAHPKEVGLLKKEVTDKGITQYRDSPESVDLEKRHVLLPKVTSALHGLYQLHPGLGPSIMIAKRWLYSQLIDDGLWPDECTELLIASQFMKMGAQANTCQPQTGFFRFLHLLANTDWRTELTLLNFNDDMDDETRSELENRFNNERDTFPPLLIVTSYDDKHYGIWSQEAPIAPVLARVILLAKHTLSVIEQSVLHPSTVVKPSKLFTASPEGYDVLIRLNADYIPNCMANEFSSGFSQWGKPNFRLFPAGQNLLKCAITELRDAFSEFCIFFYNPCGGKDIAVIWKPDVFTEREFKITSLNGCCLTANEKGVICKKDALIEDFKIILKDMFVSIEETNK